MKNQYFGDVNDYRKYSLLHSLASSGLSIAVCWMLTPDASNAKDGRLLGYLDNPNIHRQYGPDLYDKLQACRCDWKSGRASRGVCLAERHNLIPEASYYPRTLTDSAHERAQYFEDFWPQAQSREVIFFDPDNGIEVKSKAYGSKNSSKYLYWCEIYEAWSRGHSLVVYQHFPHEKRSPFIERRVHELMDRTGARQVYSWRTPSVCFFMLVQQRHRTQVRQAVSAVVQRWWNARRYEMQDWPGGQMLAPTTPSPTELEEEQP